MEIRIVVVNDENIYSTTPPHTMKCRKVHIMT